MKIYGEHNTDCFEAQGIEPYIASDRQTHNLSLEERLASPPSLPQNPDAVAAMKHRLKTEAGKQFYAKRKSTTLPSRALRQSPVLDGILFAKANCE